MKDPDADAPDVFGTDTASRHITSLATSWNLYARTPGPPSFQTCVGAVRQRLSKLSYKPGVRFRFYTHYEFAHITIEAEVPDALRPNEHGATFRALFTMGFGASDIIRMAESEHYFLDRLFSFIKLWEEHEAGEFFTHNGTRPFDPHAGETDVAVPEPPADGGDTVSTILPKI